MTYYKIESPKVIYPKIEILTVDEVLKFVKYVREVETYDINRIRSELLIFLAFKSGMRNSEMINLKLDDVYREDLSIRGKGAKDRMVFIVDHIRKLTEEYKYWRSQPIPRT